MTLWQLAQKLKEKGSARLSSVWGYSQEDAEYAAALEYAANAVEQWAREKAKEADSVDAYPFKNQLAKEISKDFSDALRGMLGVPKEGE